MLNHKVITAYEDHQNKFVMPNAENQLSKSGRIFAGFLLILFTVLPIYFLIGLWPDRMPEANGSQWYQFKLFRMQLASEEDSSLIGNLHINTILFLLVAIAGFLGSMIHLATSFTNYIGAGQFKRSWILWYLVKPFTATAVALVFYLVLKAGLLSFDGGSGINPYGLVIMAALAGLFTDKATIKLEEIFTTLFKPRDERPDKLEPIAFKVDKVEPGELIISGENRINITGLGFEKNKHHVRLGDIKITEEQNSLNIKPTLITFDFKVDPVLQDQNELNLIIENGLGEELFVTTLTIQTVTVPEEVEEPVG